MKKIYLLFLILLATPFCLFTQSMPVSLRSDVTVQFVMNVQKAADRVAKDPISKDIFYITTSGFVYQVKNISTSPSEVQVYSAADHGIDFLQGMLFVDSTLFLIGNHIIDSTQYVGLIKKGVLNSAGVRVWSSVLNTEPYAQSWTWYDHGFSGIAVSSDKAWLYFSSGSRTDHGEEQNNYGLYPGMREVPLTSAIFRIPANSNNLYFPNDSAQLAPYLYADGTRNSFDLAFDANGNLFGTENSGDRDDPDELNWIRQGKHYGFPWMMGGDQNPQQFPWYNPSTDKLLNHQCNCAVKGYYYNDPNYPSCAGYTFTPPIKNLGPDADKYRDTTGYVQDGTGGTNVRTFTPHRCPLGLSFDRSNLLAPGLKGDGFMASFTRGGDSTGLDPYGYPGTICDPGQDILHLQLSPDGNGEYQVQATTIVNNFNYPVDTYLDSNILYVIEYAYTGNGRLFAVTLPLDVSSLRYMNKQEIVVYPNPSAGKIVLHFDEPVADVKVRVSDVLGNCVLEEKLDGIVDAALDLGASGRGIYFLDIECNGKRNRQKIVIE